MLRAKIGFGLLFTGVLALAALRVINDRDNWILAAADLPLTADASTGQEFIARADGYAEIQIEVDASIAKDARNLYVMPTETPSALDVRWEVRHSGHIVAAGDARDYLYVEGIPSLPGRARRVIMHVPYGRDTAHWNTLGVAGSRTIARGVGRFPTRAGEQYAVSVMAGADFADLGQSAPTIVVRADRRAWQRHYKRVRVLGYGGLALIFSGFMAIAASRLRPTVSLRQR